MHVHIPELIEYDLANGMHVILHRDEHVPLVAVNLWYHVGSNDEDASRTGFAHLFEHMMFQGSANVGRTEHFTYIQNVGGTLNASTTQDRTNYYQTLPASHLELGLWLESDRMLTLDVTSSNFENQRAVVKEERRQRYDNRPYGRAYETIIPEVFPDGAYHWTTIGSMQHLDEASIDEVIAFHREHYLPNNASLAIVGSFEPDQARRAIERYFGSIPAGPEPRRGPCGSTPITTVRRVTMTDGVALPMVMIAWRVGKRFSDVEAKLDIVADLLAGGKSSRLYRSLVYDKHIAKEVEALNVSNKHAGIFLLRAIAQPGRSIEELEQAIWQELMSISGFTEHELEKGKNRGTSMFVNSMQTINGLADHLQMGYSFAHDALAGFRLNERSETITLSEIDEAFRTYLTPNACAVLHVLPQAAGSSV